MSWKEIHGWFDFDNLYDEAVARAPSDRPTNIVEVGVAFGRSLAYLAHKVIQSKKPITVWGIDPWVDDWNPDWDNDENIRPTWGAEKAVWARQQGGPFSAFLVSMREHAPKELEIVRVLRTTGVAAAPLIGSAWMVMIDGDHRYEGVRADIDAWRGRAEFMIAGHDYTYEFPGVEQAVHEAFGKVPADRSSWVVRK